MAMNPHTIYTLAIANQLEKSLIKEIYLTKDGKISFAPTEYCIYDKEINFDVIGLYNQDITNSLPLNEITSFTDINDGMMYLFIQKTIENIFRTSFDKTPDEDITPITNLILANIIRQYKLPIIAIDNPDLVRMIDDTDLEVKFKEDEVKLPFDNFLLKFVIDGVVVELFINRAINQMQGQDDETLIYAQGVMVRSDEAYYPIAVPISGNVDVGYEAEETENSIFCKKVTSFVKKLMYYFTLEKTIEYIEKTISRNNSKPKPKSLKEQKYGVTIINLFKDIRYNYHDSKSNGSSKIAHLVRGHFRKQAIGNRKESKHKIIWIQPYYTGNNLPTHNKKYSLQP